MLHKHYASFTTLKSNCRCFVAKRKPAAFQPRLLIRCVYRGISAATKEALAHEKVFSWTIIEIQASWAKLYSCPSINKFLNINFATTNFILIGVANEFYDVKK